MTAQTVLDFAFVENQHIIHPIAENMFYTYAHYRSDGRIFYIGKGSGCRHLSLSRNQHWKSIVAKEGGFKSEILANWSTETEAFEHEKFLIKCFTDLGLQLCNMTAGGEGSAGRILSEASLAKMRESLSGEKNPMYGKQVSEETRARMSEASKKTMSDAHVRAKIGASSKLRKHSSEVKAKIKASWIDPESRAARSAAMKAGWAKRSANTLPKTQIAEGAIT